jgi:hypothetical protein
MLDDDHERDGWTRALRVSGKLRVTAWRFESTLRSGIDRTVADV